LKSKGKKRKRIDFTGILIFGEMSIKYQVLSIKTFCGCLYLVFKGIEEAEEVEDFVLKKSGYNLTYYYLS